MGMSLSNAVIGKAVTEAINARLQQAIQVLMYIGEQCVNEARDKHKYTDQTGNLTSSIGYVVSDRGRIIDSSSFEVVKEGGEGASTGREYAERLARMYPTHLALIVVAGMNYAMYVNDMGLNVTDSAQRLAEKQVPKLLKRLGFKATVNRK